MFKKIRLEGGLFLIKTSCLDAGSTELPETQS